MSDFGLDSLEASFGTDTSELLQQQGITTGEYLAEIDPDSIEIDKEQPRKHVSDEWIEQLSWLIYKNGLEQYPVVEMRDETPVHRIGMCRILSYKKLKKDYPDDERFQKIPVIVREYKEREGLTKTAVVRIGQLIENHGRLNPDPLDEAKTVMELLDVEKLSRDQLIEQFEGHGRKVSQSWISKRIALAKCDKEVIADCLDAGIDDIEARILLDKISKKDYPAYSALVFQVQNDEIKGSIRSVAQKVWKEVNSNEIKPPVVDNSEHSGVGGVVDRQPDESSDYDDTGSKKASTKSDVKADEPAQEEQVKTPSVMCVEAEDISVNGNIVTVIVGDDEPNYAFTLPAGMTLQVTRGE